jgi:hypothetical protein
MAKRFDHGRPQVYFTSDFLKNHIYLQSPGQKKKAENVFLRRGRNVSTVLCLTRLEFVRLAGEVYRRQSEYRRRPNGIFTTQQAYDYWSRGGEKAKDKQRATQGTSRFRYAVRMNEDGVYAICHFDGPA